MRADISFTKLGRKPRTKRQQILCVILYFVAILSFSVTGVVFAYFTASARLQGETTFGRISVGFVDSDDSDLTNADFQQKFITKTYPGDIIVLSGIKVKNTGTHDAYVLMNVDVTITPTSSTYPTLHYNKWYNVYGEEIITNFSANSTTPTLISASGTVETNIKWEVPGDVVGAEYSNATANVTVSAYGSQTNLQMINTYVNPELYASYYICKNASDIAQSTATTYLGHAVGGEPLMKVGDVQDTYDYTTGTVTRNNAKIEFTGEETRWYPYLGTGEGVSFQYMGFTDKTVGFNKSICSHYENKSYAWASANLSSLGIYSDHSSSMTIYFRAPAGRPDIDTIDEWRAYLAEQYSNGTPVTVWYQLATPTTEYAPASKNLYQGSPNLHYATGANDNNINFAGAIYVTKDADPKLNVVDQNLGKDIFDIMWNNPTVFSYKMKRTNNDVVNYPRFNITYYSDKTQTTSLGTANGFFNVYSNDSEWHTIYYAIPKLSNLYSGQINLIRLFLADYSNLTSRDFYIRDIQLEIGTAPTSFEPYEKAAYKYVNGKTLYAVGDILDTYDGEQAEITRNINKVTFTGEENWTLCDSHAIKTDAIHAKGLPTVSNSTTLHYICSHSTITAANYTFLTAYSTADPMALEFRNIATNWGVEYSVSAFKNMLREEYRKGTPVTVWYALDTPIVERDDKAVHAYVNGKPLYKVGEVADTYDSSTGIITRNIAKFEITGQESWGYAGGYFAITPNLGANITNRTTAVCNYYTYGTATDNQSFWIDSTGKGLRIRDINFSSADELKAYLAEQYANGSPITIWYQLATPTTEKA